MVGGSRDPLGGVGGIAGGGLISASEVARSIVTVEASAAALIEHPHKHEEGVTIPDVSGIVSCSRIRSESDVFGDRIEEAVEGLRVGGVGVGSEFILLEEIDYLEELTAAGFLTRVACSGSEEQPSALPSLMRTSYAVFPLYK